MREHRVPLAEFLAGELDAASSRRVDEHLLSCESCWGAVQQDRAGRALASGLRESADADLADRIRLTIEVALPPARVRPVGADSRLPHRTATTAFAVLALVLGVLTALTLVSQHTTRRPGDSTRPAPDRRAHATPANEHRDDLACRRDRHRTPTAAG